VTVRIFLWELLEHFVSNCPSNPLFSRLRYYFYRNAIGGYSGRFESMTGLAILRPEGVFLEDGVYLGRNVLLDAAGGGSIHIGKKSIIGAYTAMFANNHSFQDPEIPIIDQGYEPGKIVIEDNCWIGSHVVILKTVTIGKGSVIGAGSIVTKDIPPMSVAAGNPARVIRSRVQ